MNDDNFGMKYAINYIIDSKNKVESEVIAMKSLNILNKLRD